MQIGMNLTAKLERNNEGSTGSESKKLVELYDISLNIPTSMSQSQPFEFEVVQEIQEKEDSSPTASAKTLSKESIMKIAFCDAKNVYAQVKPPKSLLELAKIDDYIESFDATVTEGTYDNEHNKFITDEKSNKQNTAQTETKEE